MPAFTLLSPPQTLQENISYLVFLTPHGNFLFAGHLDNDSPLKVCPQIAHVKNKNKMKGQEVEQRGEGWEEREERKHL